MNYEYLIRNMNDDNFKLICDSINNSDDLKWTDLFKEFTFEKFFEMTFSKENENWSLNIFKKIINHPKIKINFIDEDDWTALMYLSLIHI